VTRPARAESAALGPGAGQAVLGRVLVDCVRDGSEAAAVPSLAAFLDRYGTLVPLVAHADRHGVAGCLWQAVRATGRSDVDGADQLRELRAAATVTHLRMLSELDMVSRVLGAAAVPYLVLKGPVLAGALYRRPDLRSYVDLDLLVAPADFGAALGALEQAGCRVFERNWTLAADRMLGELRLFTRAGTVLDLHWHVIADRQARALFPIDLAAARSRARTVQVGGRSVSTLDAADTVVHLALHAALAGGHRLLWLKDLEQALRPPQGPEWTVLSARAAQWAAGPGVALMLDRAAGTLGVPVPAGFARSLVPDRPWRLVTRAADRLSPPARGAGSGPSLGRIVARAARGDGPASRRELRRRLVGWAASTAARSDPRGSPAMFDPTDPDSAAYPAGGHPARAAYLAAVARQR
jgi:Uncharacterised nucleotidyltransferase